MTPDAVLEALRVQGFAVCIVGCDGLAVTPASTLPETLREMLRVNKTGILELLRDARETTKALVDAAMRACAHHGSGERDREQMCADCIATPAHLRADLLAHFTTTYPKDGQHENNRRKSSDE